MSALEILRVPLNGVDVACVVTSREEVSIPLERTVDKRTVYETTGYTAVKVRPATQEEAQRWRCGE